VRALITTRTTVPGQHREAYLSVAADQRRKVTEAGGNYWLFENAEQSGDFMMFFEAPDRASLDHVVNKLGWDGLEHVPVFVEVKLN
jgi:hypothetical protein